MLHIGLNEYEAVQIESKVIEQDQKVMEDWPLTKEASKGGIHKLRSISLCV